MKQPYKKFDVAGVSVALWENSIQVNGQTRTVLKASVSRRYRDREGNWKNSTSFSQGDIPVLMYGLGQSYKAILDYRRESKNSAQGE